VLLRKRFVAWDRWRYLDLVDDRDLFDRFEGVDLRTWGVVGLFGRNEAQRDLLARIDDRLSRWVPDRWRYIVFGACTRGPD
jgi:hypothetical protein